MPEPADNEYGQQVRIGSSHAISISTEAYVEVVTHPETECHVPSAPEIGKGFSAIGSVEILWKMESHDSA